MDQLKFSPDEKRSILRICAAILHLGNIEFAPNKDGTGSVIVNEPGSFTFLFLFINFYHLSRY